MLGIIFQNDVQSMKTRCRFIQVESHIPDQDPIGNPEVVIILSRLGLILVISFHRWLK